MLNVFPVPAFKDNYFWVIDDGQFALVVDPGQATPVIAYLVQKSLTLAAILITHHHADHIGGIGGLLDWCDDRNNVVDVAVYGPANEKIPYCTHPLNGGATVNIASPALSLNVIDVPGHTAGHIAYYAEREGWLFCGDTLFAGGCGRLFEGTAAQMRASLGKLAALPAETNVFCAHEYTLANLLFASAVEPNNAALRSRVERDTAMRERGEPTVPSTIALERATNPFLRWDEAEVKLAAARVSSGTFGPNAPADLVFAAIREWKDNF
ncbi:MAG: hydroxyacylglutathione hydrolase [Rhodocyclaceae bacterium]|nr:hydroxyacylglutathione hydrolase [Rhodocyclaceae bacterium]